MADLMTRAQLLRRAHLADKRNATARRNREAAVARGHYAAADRWHLFACYWNGVRAAYVHAAGGGPP